MGVGRFQHARHASQRTHRQGRGPGLQLVELVRACGQPTGPARSADQSTAAAGSGGASGAYGWANAGVSHADARRSGPDQKDDRQYPS
ncbi:MAG: hypothetical protein EBU51_02425, partial [Synechococcaceae bacterium WB6_3A_227]|nr:hypothetical protein [Synechococcaceae bacterium WB6_3A_227]